MTATGKTEDRNGPPGPIHPNEIPREEFLAPLALYPKPDKPEPNRLRYHTVGRSQLARGQWRRGLLEGETPARKAWIGAIVDRIEANRGTIRIIGRKDVWNRRLRTAARLRRVFAHVYRSGAP